MRRMAFRGGAALGCVLALVVFARIVLPSDLPLVVALPDAHHAAVLLVHAERPIVVADLDTHALARTGSEALLHAAPQAHVVDAWWSPTASRLIVLTRRTGERDSVVWSSTPDGELTLVTRIGAAELWAGYCTLLEQSQRIACAIREGSEDDHHVMRITIYALGHPRSVETHVWEEPLHAFGRARVTPDGASVVYSDRSPVDTHRAGSLYRAAIDGSARTHLGPVDGYVGDIAISPDGQHVAIGAYDGETWTSCSHLWALDLGTAGAQPRRIADLRPAEAGLRYRGVSSLQFSPDGSRIAFMSDELEGCSWLTAVESCRPMLSVVGFDGHGHERISTHVLQGVVTWMQ
jgi:dipeptidyl aminopeptidase/acylaminoacyl peptidase